MILLGLAYHYHVFLHTRFLKMAKLTSDTSKIKSYIPPNPNFKCTNRLSKGQEISEGNCGVFNSPKELIKIISLISALAVVEIKK